MRQIAKNVVRLSARRGFVSPFVRRYAGVIREFNGAKPNENLERPALLALQADRFRGDLSLLSEHSGFRILTLPFDWQMRLVMLFYPRSAADDHGEPVFVPNSLEVETAKAELRSFLRDFLSALYQRLNIRATLSAGGHYWRDLDWGAVSSAIGHPYIVLHRECLITRPALYGGAPPPNRDEIPTTLDFTLAGFGRWKPFQGDVIITHNEVMREAFLRSGYASPDQVHALGAMRMDDYVKRVRNLKTQPVKPRRLVTFFSFTEGAHLWGMRSNWSPDGKLGWVRLFDSVHAHFARLAIRRPDIDFVVKLKWEGNTERRLALALERYGVDVRDCDNFKITDTGSAHDLIVESAVVVGFGSTALLEAAIAGKPVVVPNFEEAAEAFYAPHVPFADHLHLFDVAESGEELQEIIVKRLDDPMIEAGCAAEREIAFDNFLSDIDANATPRYIELIRRVALASNESVIGSPHTPV